MIRICCVNVLKAEWGTLTRLIWVLLRRQEFFNMLIRSPVLAVCQEPGFEVRRPFCQKSARNFFSKHHGKILVNLQKKHLKSLILKEYWVIIVHFKNTLIKQMYVFLTKLGMSRNRGNTSKTVAEFCWFWTSVWRYWNVAIILSLTTDTPVECFNKDIASRHSSPNSCLSARRKSLLLFGLYVVLVEHLRDWTAVLRWTVFILQAK